ncbi:MULTISPECIES: PDR/VanB family oxidoreductase [Burkholderiaceae]|uniref:PDR/VanB family oxidoreductase n=1 Tax=Burkholderiaceae TaxID=119060 RepID=UPI00141FC874|nr:MULTISPECIES: PDR/VanB family oxidoreductase [Burkholderiaceae]MBN3851136.1 oxidoreductase [Paraburkholderia sp. Ac-20342]NIF51256.1 oxidoreductase [Burkholderia sp. Ax-1724]
MFKVKVIKKQRAAEGICRFELERVDGAPLPPFTAGAHIDVFIRPGLVRQYSLCNAPRERHQYVIAVLQDPQSRGGSVAMHTIDEGDIVEISEPRNHFSLVDGATRSVLVAGGIGITPILSMVYQLHEDDASFELHYCARDTARMALRDDLEALGLADRAHLYLDAEGTRINFEQVLGQPEQGAHLYVCGPSGFIAAVLDAAKTFGWNANNVHREHFGLPQTGTDTGGSPFTVRLARSGASVTVMPEESIVKALARIGVEIPVSCEQGVCGTCLTRVLDGIPEHRDAYLMENEKAVNDQILPCCSRAVSDVLVLDI